MVRTTKHLLALMALGGVASGCAGSTDLAFDELTQDEAPALAQVVLFATFNSTSVLPTRPDSPIGNAGWDMAFEAEVRCPRGGRVGLGASLSVTGQGDQADYQLRQIHDACAGAIGERRFEVSGAAPMLADVSVAHAMDGSVVWTGSTEGEIDWRSVGRTGRCTFRLDFVGAAGPETDQAVALVGTMCGYSLDTSVPVAPD